MRLPRGDLHAMLAVPPAKLEEAALRLRTFCRLLAERLRDAEDDCDAIELSAAAAELADDLWSVLAEQTLHGHEPKPAATEQATSAEVQS